MFAESLHPHNITLDNRDLLSSSSDERLITWQKNSLWFDQHTNKLKSISGRTVTPGFFTFAHQGELSVSLTPSHSYHDWVKTSSPKGSLIRFSHFYPLHSTVALSKILRGFYISLVLITTLCLSKVTYNDTLPLSLDLRAGTWTPSRPLLWVILNHSSWKKTFSKHEDIHSEVLFHSIFQFYKFKIYSKSNLLATSYS